MPKISAKLKRGHSQRGVKCRWGRLNAVAVAENWLLSTQSVVNLARSQVYHTQSINQFISQLCKKKNNGRQ